LSDLVHADPLPAEQQNGQLTAVARAVERMRKVVDDGGNLTAAEAAWLAHQMLSRRALASPNDEGKAE
jgi:hypothetical protein